MEPQQSHLPLPPPHPLQLDHNPFLNINNNSNNNNSLLINIPTPNINSLLWNYIAIQNILNTMHSNPFTFMLNGLVPLLPLPAIPSITPTFPIIQNFNNNNIYTTNTHTSNSTINNNSIDNGDDKKQETEEKTTPTDPICNHIQSSSSSINSDGFELVDLYNEEEEEERESTRDIIIISDGDEEDEDSDYNRALKKYKEHHQDDYSPELISGSPPLSPEFICHPKTSMNVPPKIPFDSKSISTQTKSSKSNTDESYLVRITKIPKNYHEYCKEKKRKFKWEHNSEVWNANWPFMKKIEKRNNRFYENNNPEKCIVLDQNIGKLDEVSSYTNKLINDKEHRVYLEWITRTHAFNSCLITLEEFCDAIDQLGHDYKKQLKVFPIIYNIGLTNRSILFGQKRKGEFNYFYKGTYPHQNLKIIFDLIETINEDKSINNSLNYTLKLFVAMNKRQDEEMFNLLKRILFTFFQKGKKSKPIMAEKTENNTSLIFTQTKINWMSFLWLYVKLFIMYKEKNFISVIPCPKNPMHTHIKFFFTLENMIIFHHFIFLRLYHSEDSNHKPDCLNIMQGLEWECVCTSMY